MNVNGIPRRSIWLDSGQNDAVKVIDQRLLPHAFHVVDLTTWHDAREAIAGMTVRGAPLIGATAAYGVYLAAITGEDLDEACAGLQAARPTAVNLKWAVDRQQGVIRSAPADLVTALRDEAARICEEDVKMNRAIGNHGVRLIRELHEKHPGRPVQVMTHCNAGWLATVDWGTALAPVYLAHNEGIPLHVWVDETRPRNQGAGLTAWELGQHGVPHAVITDNAGGHLMQRGSVDLLLTGTDRTTCAGDVCNKIGTYLKALAAKDNGVPFYVALPSPSIDWSISDGLKGIPIEERDGSEVTHVTGWEGGRMRSVRVTPEGTPAANYGFDVTPSRLVTGLITERGICEPSEKGLRGLFPEGDETRISTREPA